MKVLFLFGNGAVGKMTVGQELTKITSLRLFHNHMTIEPVIEIFGAYLPDIVDRLRWVIFEEFAKTDNYGLIFTFMWALDNKEDRDYVDRVKKIFLDAKPDTEFFYAELVAPRSIRLERNATENRLTYKPSKRDIEQSNIRLLDADKKHRFESLEGEFDFDNYVKIDNSALSAEKTAQLIKETFCL